MRRGLVILCAFAAAALGYAALAADDAPTVAFTTPIGLVEVRDCLLRGSDGVKDYMNFPVPPAQVTERSDMTRINFLADSRIYVELWPHEGGGTDVRYFRHLRKLRPASSYDDVVRSCETPPR